MKLLIIIFLLLSNTCAIAQVISPGLSASSLYHQGINAMRSRRFTAATESFERILEKFPNDQYAPLARKQLAKIYKDTNQHTKAMELLHYILQNDTSSNNQKFAKEKLVEILFSLQRFREGINLLEQWREAHREDTWIIKQLSRFYRQSGRGDEAWLLLQTTLERTYSRKIFSELLEMAVRTGKVESLIQALENRRSIYRQAAFADFVSDCYLALNQHEKAIAIMKNTDGLENEINLLQKLADLQIRMNKHSDAIDSLKMVLKILPNDRNTLLKLGRAKFATGEKEKALEIWRRPLEATRFPRREFFQDYTSILIEHRMLKEALEAFEEGRRRLRNPTLFSEELATLLLSMGKHDEAMEEYLQVFESGQFKLEVFDQLYESSLKGFDLEGSLLLMSRKNFNISVMRALIELYFRNSDMNKLDVFTGLIRRSAGVADEYFINRLKQDSLLFPDEFDFAIAKRVAEARITSSTALELGVILLDMAALDKTKQESVFKFVEHIVFQETPADIDLKVQLLLKKADFALKELHNAKRALELIEIVLDIEYVKRTPRRKVAAKLAKIRVCTMLEKYDLANTTATQLNSLLEGTSIGFNSLDFVAMQDYSAALLLEKANLKAHQKQYQPALNHLKKLLTEYPNSKFVNNALDFALYITRRSTGDLTMLEKFLAAERLKYSGNPQEASQTLENVIKQQGQPITELIVEAKADIIMLKASYKDHDKIKEMIREFRKNYPDTYKLADLYELKLFVMRQQNSPASQQQELMLQFIELFPNDLRRGRFESLLVTNPN